MPFQAQVRAFLAQHDLGHAPETHALDLVSEVGEVAKALLEASEYGRSPLVADAALAGELGDAFFSLIALAESLGVDLETALQGALDKYATRLRTHGHAGSQANPAPQNADYVSA
jgi:NTP pyrophosphatase (non-canonical NTP hydrolase)